MKELKDRLLDRIKINIKSGCWEWQGNINNGYGKLTIGSRTDKTRRTVSAHRLAYLTFVGKIPENMEVCHKCDNRKCINPEHLFVGTHQDNINDRERKGRNIIHFGESNPRAKLTQKDVLAMRQRKSQENISYENIAKEFGVCKKTAQEAIKGINWKCVRYMPDPPEKGE